MGEALLQAEYERRLEEPSDIQDHLRFLYGAVATRLKPRVIELGVRRGNSTAALLAGVEHTDGFLWSCDIEVPQVPEQWHSLECWRFILGDDLSAEVQAAMPPECDVLFLDTSHEFELTVQELHAYVPRVRSGGLVAVHDTEWLHPARRLPGPTGPVAYALDKFCTESGLSWVNRPGCYGMGVIQV